MPIHILPVFQTLIVIGSANTAPLILKRFLGEYLARPIDGGLVLADGRPLLGRSKTWRGLAGAVFLATLGAVVVGLPWQAGALAGAAAMLGDCLSSFTKRRMGLQPSQMALGIDQVPESLLASMTCGLYVPLSLTDLGLILLLFFIGELGFSRLLFAFGLRDRPY